MEHIKASELSHRSDRIGRCGLDVVVLSCCYRTVPQNPLDHRVIHAQAVQIRRQAPAEPVPAVPQKSRTLEHIFHFPLIASVQIERMSE